MKGLINVLLAFMLFLGIGLLGLTRAKQIQEYVYDGVGNRTASHLSTSYSYQPFNKLTSTATATYSYDNNGNLRP